MSPLDEAAPDPVRARVDDLFRRSYGRMVATLARILGPERIELAEDVVQEALLKALRHWSFHEPPRDPHAWLVRVAKNLALDQLRRDAALRSKEAEIRAWPEDPASGAPGESDGPRDDQLAMIFACCHPSLAPESRVALTLKTVGGFGVAEIARAFLADEPTIAQRLVRAKNRLRDERVAIEVPSGPEVAARLDSVLEVVYLLFNEGLLAHCGDELVRVELVREALRLGELLARDPATRTPAVHALVALMAFHAARLPARLGPDGDPLLLEEQDRARWDRSLIARGFAHLRLAGRGDELRPLHVEAAIASCHAAAESWSATDWPRILAWYDVLGRMRPSPVVALNRAVAVAMVEGPDAGLRALAAVEDHPRLAAYHLRASIKGELLRRVGRDAEAAACFDEALALTRSGPERRFLLRRRATCSAVLRQIGALPIADLPLDALTIEGVTFVEGS